jgi:hypothetical protein
MYLEKNLKRMLLAVADGTARITEIAGAAETVTFFKTGTEAFEKKSG